MHLLRPPGVLEEALEAPHTDCSSRTARRLTPADHSIIRPVVVFLRREFDRPLRSFVIRSRSITGPAIGLRR